MDAAFVALLSSARSIGVIGSILTLLIIIPVGGAIFAIIGWVLIIIAVNQVADIAGDRKILNDVLIAAVLAVVGIAAFAVTVLGSVLRFFSINGVTGFASISRVNGTLFASGTPHGIDGLIVGVVVGLVVFWAFLLGSAIFLRKGYERISDKMNVKMFATAALIYLIGAALTIVLVGLLLVFVAGILQTLAFFSLPDEVPGQTPRPVPMTVPPPPSS
jgi:uncharacterized membrane protein